MEYAVRLFSLLFLAGVAIAGLAWIVGSANLRNRALVVAAIGLGGLVGLPILERFAANMGVELRLVVERDLHGHVVIAAAPVAVGHVVLAHWLLTRRARAERQRDEARERQHAMTRERTRLTPPDDMGNAS